MQDETALSVPEAPDPAEPLVRELALLARGPGAAPSTELLTAYAAAAAPNSLRAFRADMLAFDAWCRHRRARTLPAEAATVAAFLAARAGQGVLQRHWPGTKSIARLHRLCRLADPTQDELVKLTLAAIRRDKDIERQ